jgi:putative ABC transport system substrate-binding protein
MRRREFITLLSSFAAAWPLAARAQHDTKPRVIGFMSANAASAISHEVDAFVQRLGELGWIEGRNIVIEYRWADGQFERLAGFAADFVQQKVDIIVAEGTAAVVAAKQMTATIPIVFPLAGDPIGNKLVASLGRPGGNVTGLSIQSTDLAPKRLELFREMVPSLTRLAIMANVNSPNTMLEVGEVQATARSLGLDATVVEVRRAEDIAPAFEAIKGRVDAVYIAPDPLVLSNRVRINALALGLRLPTMYAYRDYVETGGLMSYGPNLTILFRRTGDFVNGILHGAKPSELPIEQPTKFDLVVNLATAKALGLTIPESFVLRADEVIE